MSKGIIKKTHEVPILPFSFTSFGEEERASLYTRPGPQERMEGDEGESTPLGASEGAKGEEEKTVEPMPLPDIQELVSQRLAEAERQAQEMYRKAFEEGRSDGYQNGYEQGLRDAVEAIRRVETLLETLQRLPQKIMEDYREWLVHAAFTIAKQILRTELTSRPQSFLSMIAHLAQQMEESSLITVYLNPEDLALLRIGADIEEWTRLQGKSIRLMEDSTLERGSCRLENDIEFLDGSLDKVIEEWQKEIFAEFAGKRVEEYEG